MLDFLYRGLLMDEAGDAGGGGGAAVADVGSESTALTTTDTTDLATIDDGAADDDTGGGEESSLQEFRALENGRPSKTTSAALATIKATHPQLARQIPRALAVEARLRSEFPGQNPFDGLRAMQRTLKSLGGEEGIAQIRQSLADMEEMDLLYAGGDARMLEKMTQTPEGKAAFVKIAPHAFSMYEKLSRNGFTKYMAGVILGDIIGQRVDMTLSRIAELTPREINGPDGTKIPNPVATELAKLDAYIKRLQTYEQLPDDAPASKTDPREQELETERQKLARERKELALQGWRSAADTAKQGIFQRAWAAETKGKKISAVDKEDIQSRFWTRLPIALRQIAGFNESLKEFFDNDDRDGYLRYLQSLHTQKIPVILRAEIQRRYGAPAAAVVTPPAQNGIAAPKGQVDAGYKRVATMPAMGTVNQRMTNTEMWKKGRAVLKDGSKVQWK